MKVIRHEQVQQSVAVVVQERGTGSPADFRLRQSGLLRDICKGTVPAIPIEHVAPPERDVHVLISVVVVIAYSRAGRPAHPRQSRFGSRLLEPSVSEVSMQLQRAFRWRVIESGAAHDQRVQPAVRIVVEPSRSSADGFDDKVLAVGLPVDRGPCQARACGHIDQAGTKGYARGLASRGRTHPPRCDALRREDGSEMRSDQDRERQDHADAPARYDSGAADTSQRQNDS